MATGSICLIIQNPNDWRYWVTDRKLKPKYGGEILCKIIYGTFDDDPIGAFDLEMYMRKSILDNLLNGKYTIDPESRWKRKLVVLDENKNEIQPLKEDFCY